ncbi:probable serine/threonine-protein kinase At1g54610 isoform X2 [Asparagus officinalis]|uniref:probable serine/threonine-protein kinase At1g54610 isoform X2 n=1 Tax=Asparagus officinalis TaxID=4686 RepID=UPI00098E61EF|nr:probable serine/threonine-protein kinase At1g54610 isoform X2 [Asparagus officinalis]
MGCICSKGINKDEILADIESTKSSRQVATPSKEVEGSTPDVEANPVHRAAPPRSLSKRVLDIVSVPVVAAITRVANGHQRNVTVNAEELNSRNGEVANGVSTEYVIAGWPSWLTSVAAEAIKGWLPRRAESFEKLDKIGQGTYSSVYRARDLETGKIVALKKVRFVNMDPESVRFMAREIHILRKLDHPNVIKLEGIVTSRVSCSLYLVFEYMEHDLAGLIATPGIKFTEPQVKCFMQQLLSGLDHCHSRGVLHRDIKGSNLLIDSNGVLKIGDFGLASVFGPAKKQPMTSRVVTLWYRPPELLLGATVYGVAVDLWSSGCILAELFAGKPIFPGRNEVEQLHKIFKLCGSPAEDYWKKANISQSTIFRPQHPYPRRVNETFKKFPSSTLNLLDTLLAIEPDVRGTATSALQSEFFTTEPLACDPSSLPKYPPSKEYDAKLRDQESRRQKAASKVGTAEAGGRGDSQAQQPQDYSTGVQKQANINYSRENYNLAIEPPSEDGYRHAGSTMHPGAYGNSRSKNPKNGDHRNFPGRSVSTLKTNNGAQLRTQRSYITQHGDAGDLASFAGVSRNTAGSRYNRPASSHRKNDREGKDFTVDYGIKNKRIHNSGPLMGAGGNMDNMLKEHERQIQQAVRKACLDNKKT